MFETQDQRGLQPRYIEDITPPLSAGFDARDAKVRHSSIGFLDAKYMNLPHIRGGNNKAEDEGEVIEVRRPALKSGFTRIPPLATISRLDDEPAEQPGTQVKERVTELAAGVGNGVSHAEERIEQQVRSLPWLPKKYSLYKGVYTDWHTKTFTYARWSMPAIIMLGVVTLGAMMWWPMSNPPAIKRSEIHTEKPSTISKPASNQTSSNSNDTGGAGNTASSPGYTMPISGNNITTPSMPVVQPVTTTVDSTVPATTTPDPTTTPAPTPTTQPVDQVVNLVNQPLQQVQTVVSSTGL